MAFSLYYDTGTISVANGSASVTGSGVTWSSVREGDTLRDPATGVGVPIASIEDTNGALTLLYAWPGTSLSDDAYIITYDSPSRRSAVTLAATLETFVANQTLLLAQRTDIDLAGFGDNDPPVGPVEGDAYIVGDTPTGDWIGKAGYIAVYSELGAWTFTAPAVGTEAVDTSVDPPVTYIRGSSSWVLRNGAHTLDDLQDVDAAAPVAGDVLTYDGVAWIKNQSGCRNLLFNSGGVLNQRGATSQADDTYGFDRWVVLTQTGVVAVSTLSDVADGVPSMMRLTQSQATAQRMGQAQILEAADSKWMRGRAVTLSGKVRCSASATVRYAILAWTGTADTVTSDVVADWTSGSYTAGGFFLGSNLTVVGVGSTVLSADTFADLAPLTVEMPSGLNNTIIMYWSEGALAQSVTIDAALQLEEGALAHPLAFRVFAQEQLLCRRYFIAMGGDAPYQRFWSAMAISTTALRATAMIPEMRKNPTASFSIPSHFTGDSGTGGLSASAITAYDYAKTSFTIEIAVTGATLNIPYYLIANNTTSARIYIDAEL